MTADEIHCRNQNDAKKQAERFHTRVIDILISRVNMPGVIQLQVWCRQELIGGQ